MDGKDPNSQIKIINNEMDILERYPNMFSEKEIGEDTYYLEKPLIDTDSIHRFFITPSGPLMVCSLGSNDIWEIDGNNPNDIDLLLEMNETVANTRSLHLHDLLKEKHINSTPYFLRIFPYSHKESTEHMVIFLDSRYK